LKSGNDGGGILYFRNFERSNIRILRIIDIGQLRLGFGVGGGITRISGLENSSSCVVSRVGPIKRLPSSELSNVMCTLQPLMKLGGSIFFVLHHYRLCPVIQALDISVWHHHTLSVEQVSCFFTSSEAMYGET